MIAVIEKLEATEITEIVDKYRQQGYQVLVKPRHYEWQKFIQNQEIDLIICTVQKSVIAALKPRPPESKSQKTSEEEMMQPSYDYRQHDLYDIQFYMKKALEMIEKGNFELATCSIGSITESVMRMVAEHHSIDFEIQEPPILAQTFLAHGLMNGEDYEVLVAALEIRDRVIFQREKVTVELNLARRAFEALQRLLSQSGQVEE
jgi:REase_AHJR-like